MALMAAAVSTTNMAINTAERRLLLATWSYKGELDLGGARSDGNRVAQSATDQNSTFTGPLASPSASKYSRSVKWNMPAKIDVGTVWILVL
jgi:hypothetical protein